MNEFKRCINVFSHSPFKVRLMLIGMLCEMINGKTAAGQTQFLRRRRGTPLHFSVIFRR